MYGVEIIDGYQVRFCKKVIRIRRNVAHGASEWELDKV
jgi:hypothetical protein